jgi:oligopeptide transport system permease protein
VRTAPRFVAAIDEGGLGAVDVVRVSDRTSNLWLDAWRDLRSRPMFWIAAVVIAVVVFVAFFPSLFTDFPPQGQGACDLGMSNKPPAPGHPLGFTVQGCDVFSRILYGTRTSLSVGLLATVIIAFIGIIVGAFSGYFGGWLDSVLMRIGDMFFAIPYVLAGVVVMSVFMDYRNVFMISLAIGFFAWASTSRVLRAEVLRVKQSDYVMASAALGLSRVRTMFTHVMPNSITPVIILSTVGLAGAITAEATLSFLGVGLPPSVMSWGNDISAAQNYIRQTPMPLIWPSLALSITVLAFIMLGETVRDALDPKARALR